MTITIVGLGPGDSRYLTREAWHVLQTADMLYIRTAHHPVIPELTMDWHSFDNLYETADNYETVYQMITDKIIALGSVGDVVYAVPGDPHMGETAVLAIKHAATIAGVSVHVVSGISFLEPTLAALQLDGFDGLQLFDAMVVAQQLHPPVSPDTPLLLGQVYNQLLAGEIKLTLLAMYPPEHMVQLVHGAGTDEAIVESLPLYQIDRSQQLHNLSSLYVPPSEMISSLANFAETVAVLRSPHGCPWDRKQTPQTMRSGLLEETAEVIDALDRDDTVNLQEELGDLLLHIVMQAQMASEADDFTLTDVIAGIESKIRRRHPHVWGDVYTEDASMVAQTWEEIKAIEKREQGKSTAVSILDSIPLSLSSLARSSKIQNKVRKVGFEWPDITGVWDKLAEEIVELKEAKTPADIESEWGDVLFVLVKLATWLNVDAETAARGANRKFIRRFQAVEQLMCEQNMTFDDVDLEYMEKLWQKVKMNESTT